MNIDIESKLEISNMITQTLEILMLLDRNDNDAKVTLSPDVEHDNETFFIKGQVFSEVKKILRSVLSQRLVELELNYNNLKDKRA